MIRIFLRVESAINRVIGHVASACLVVAAVSAFYQVVTRFIFEQPSTWSEALTRTYSYYDPIHTLPAEGQAWWAANASSDESALKAAEVAEASRRTAALQAY